MIFSHTRAGPALCRCGLLLLPALFVQPAAAAPEVCAGTLTLPQAELRLLTDNPDLRVAHHDLDGARADLAIAGERPNPSLSLGSSAYDPRRGLGPGNALHKEFDTVLGIEQPIERGGKRGLRRAAALSGERAAQADFADQKRQALLSLRQAFYDLELAAQKLAIDRDIADSESASMRAARLRLSLGDIAAADLARLQVEASKADADVQQAEADLRSARVTLAYLIGCGADASFDADGEWPAPATLPDAAGVDADRRADVAAARARAAQAHSTFELAKAQRVHDLSVGLQVEHYPNSPPAPSDGQLLLGFDISVPIHLFHAYEGEIAHAASDDAAGGDALARARAQAAADLAQAHSDLVASTARAQSYRETILPQARTAAEAIEYAYTHGAAPLLDLLDARRTLHATRIEAATAASDYAKALAVWRAAGEAYADAPPIDSPIDSAVENRQQADAR